MIYNTETSIFESSYDKSVTIPKRYHDKKYKLISKKEFQNNRDKYATPSQNTVTCYDTILKKHVQIATEEYFSNRGKYKHFAENKVRVYNENGEIKFVDNLNWLESMQGTLMKTVFKNGKMVKEESLNDIRQRLNDNQF